jgi:hypothetical protein
VRHAIELASERHEFWSRPTSASTESEKNSPSAQDRSTLRWSAASAAVTAASSDAQGASLSL